MMLESPPARLAGLFDLIAVLLAERARKLVARVMADDLAEALPWPDRSASLVGFDPQSSHADLAVFTGTLLPMLQRNVSSRGRGV